MLKAKLGGEGGGRGGKVKQERNLLNGEGEEGGRGERGVDCF